MIELQRTLLFDPSASALPIIETQKSQSVCFTSPKPTKWGEKKGHHLRALQCLRLATSKLDPLGV